MEQHLEISQVRRLTVEERRKARDRAINAIMPVRETRSFEQKSYGKYPDSMINMILGLCLFLLVVFFFPSAIRVFDLGKTIFAMSINDATSPNVVGWSLVIGGEIAVIIFSLASILLPEQLRGGKNWPSRILNTLMFMSGSIALVGNIQRSDLFDHLTLFAVLEAVAPPIAVLGTSYVLKLIFMTKVENRHATKVAWEKYEEQRKTFAANPESNPTFHTTLINVMRATIIEANKHMGKARLDNGLTKEQWSVLVARELDADNWYTAPPREVVQEPNFT